MIPPEEVALVFGRGVAVTAVAVPSDIPPTTTVGVWHVSTGSDSAVLKVIRLTADGDPRWPAEADPADPYYWRREALVYESGLLERLEGGLRAPACRGVFERADGSVAVWLEEVPPAPPWTPERLAAVAYGLARAQATLAAEPPREPWLARGWLRTYLALHDAPDPELEAVLARLNALPQTLCHNDPHPGNVLGVDGEVLIDWAYCGPGALGLDAGVVIADAVSDGAIEPELAEEAGRLVWDAYATGLADAAWRGRLDDVRYAYLRGTALRLSWLPVSRSRMAPDDPRRRRWAATTALLRRWREQAHELA